MFSRFQGESVENASIGRVVVKNSLYNLLSKFISTLVGIGLTPFIVSYLKLDLYGVWCIMFVVLGYIALLDLGIGTSFMKFIAEYKVMRDMELINKVINSGLVFYSVLGVITIGVTTLLSERFTSFLSVPMKQKHDVVISFIACGIIFAMSCVFSVFNLTIGGLQRMDVSSKIEIVRTLLQMIATITFLKMGYGLKGLVGSYAIASLITGVLAIWNTRNLFPGLKIRLRFFNFKLFRDLVVFGAKNQIASFSDLMTFQLSKVFVGKFIGLSTAGAYEVGSKIPRQLREAVILLFQPLLPATSEMAVLQNRSKIIRMYFLCTKMLIIGILPIVIFIFFTSKTIIFCWLGLPEGSAAMTLQVLSLAYFLNFGCGVASVITIGMGRPEILMRYGIISGILTPIISFFLLMKYHLLGLLLGTGITLLISNGYFLIAVHRFLKVPLGSFIKKVYSLPFIISLAFGYLAQLLNKLLFGGGFISSRLGQLGCLMAELIVIMGSVLIITTVAHYLDQEEYQMLVRHFPIFIKRPK